MSKAAAICFLRRNSLGTVSRTQATLIATVFGRTLSDLGPEFRDSGRVAIPELACALAEIKVEIPTHLLHLISRYNTERAMLRLAQRAESKSAPDNYVAP